MNKRKSSTLPSLTRGMSGKKKNVLGYAVILLFIAAVMTAAILWNASNPVGYTMYNSQSISYDKGRVVEIIDESLQREDENSSRWLGTQQVLVQMNSGELKGSRIEVNNILSTDHNILLGAGDAVIVKVDSPEGIEPFYSIYNYDRTGGIVIISAVFLLMLILIGKTKGLRSALGIFFTLFFIIEVLLPMLYHGYSPILCCFITVLLTSTVCLTLLTGISKKTLLNLASVLIGIAVVSGFYLLFTQILDLSGYNGDEAEELVIISQNTGLNIGQLLFVGVTIASLGAVMDMTMSISSPLFEMKRLRPDIGFREIVESGLSIGKDMSGTMSQTLILAFIGSALTAMLSLMSYGVSVNQFLSSNYMAIEFLHGIIGGTSVIISIPVTVLMCAWFLCRGKRQKQKEGRQPESRKTR